MSKKVTHKLSYTSKIEASRLRQVNLLSLWYLQSHIWSAVLLLLGLPSKRKTQIYWGESSRDHHNGHGAEDMQGDTEGTWVDSAQRREEKYILQFEAAGWECVEKTEYGWLNSERTSSKGHKLQEGKFQVDISTIYFSPLAWSNTGTESKRSCGICVL